MRIFWILPILGALAAVVVILFTIVASTGAPQEAAGFAMASALAIVPYVFTRALLALVSERQRESTDRIVDAIGRAALDARLNSNTTPRDSSVRRLDP